MDANPLWLWLFTLFAAPALAGEPAAGPKSYKPAVVVKAQPVGKLLDDLRAQIRVAEGPVEGPKAVEKFQKNLEDAVGPKGFEGLDLFRPLAAYLVVRLPADANSLVLAVPVTTEAEFLALLGRLDVVPTPVAGKAGLFALKLPATAPPPLPAKDLFPGPAFARLVDDVAYVSLNGDDVTDPANLVPAADLFDPAQKAQVAAAYYPDRLPEKLVAGKLDEFENLVNAVRGFAGGGPANVRNGANTIAAALIKLARRSTALVQSAKEVTVTFTADAATGDQTLAVALVPKPASLLALAAAATGPGRNRFAGLVPADAAGGLTYQFPLLAPETRTIAAALLEMLAVESHKEAIKPLRPVSDEAFEALIRSVKAADADAAVALLGPDAGGTFTAVAALPFDAPAAMEKALREAAKDPALGKRLACDVEKADGLALHKFALPDQMVDDEYRAVFGRTGEVYFAFARNGVYLAVGPDAPAALKSAVAATAKPAAAPSTGLSGNPKRLHRLVTALHGEKAAAGFTARVGDADALQRMLSFSHDGGAALTFKATVNVKWTTAAAEPTLVK